MPRDDREDFAKFEKYLKDKSAAESGTRPGPRPVTPSAEGTTPRFDQVLGELKHSSPGELANDPEWAKFQQFLRHQESASLISNDSGLGNESVLPDELRGLNWGACILNVIWGGVMKVPGMTLFGWIALMMLPVIGVLFPFYLLVKGNEIAWRNRRWTNLDEYRETQRKWTVIGFWLAGVIIVLVAGLFFWVYQMIGSLFRA